MLQFFKSLTRRLNFIRARIFLFFFNFVRVFKVIPFNLSTCCHCWQDGFEPTALPLVVLALNHCVVDGSKHTDAHALRHPFGVSASSHKRDEHVGYSLTLAVFFSSPANTLLMAICLFSSSSR